MTRTLKLAQEKYFKVSTLVAWRSARKTQNRLISVAKSIDQHNYRSKHLPKDQTIIVLTYTRRVHLKKQPNLTFPYKIRRQDYTLNPA